MNNRWIRVAMVAMLFAVAAPLAHADDGDENGSPSTLAPLTGENLSAAEIGPDGGPTGTSTVEGECNPDPLGTSIFNFTVTGVAIGPYPGTFSETGTITLGPLGPVSFVSDFKIFAPDGTLTVDGSKVRVGFEPPPPSVGLCAPVPLPPDNADAIHFEGTVSYEATITTPAGSRVDSGESRVDFQDTQVRGVSNGFNFTETFVSTSGPAPGECDDDNDDQGDDDCDDQGEDGDDQGEDG
jgi:hypothetical protein